MKRQIKPSLYIWHWEPNTGESRLFYTQFYLPNRSVPSAFSVAWQEENVLGIIQINFVGVFPVNTTVENIPVWLGKIYIAVWHISCYEHWHCEHQWQNTEMKNMRSDDIQILNTWAKHVWKSSVIKNNDLY